MKKFYFGALTALIFPAALAAWFYGAVLQGGEADDSARSPATRSYRLFWDEDKPYNLAQIDKLKRNSHGLKIFWWNVHWGATNHYFHAQDGIYPVDENLLALAHSSIRPDILILGEFKYTALERETLSELRAHYPIELFLPYKEGSEVGILVWSRHDLVDHVQRDLDWAPVTHDREKKRDYRDRYKKKYPDIVKHWDRKYFRLRFFGKGKPFDVIPVHTLSPWEMLPKMKKEGPLALRPGRVAASTARLLWGENSPLHHQLRRIRNFVEAEYGGHPEADLPASAGPLVLIGDFNTPERAIFKTSGYAMLSEGLRDAFHNKSYTYPSWTEFQRGITLNFREHIDHAFTNRDLDVLASATLQFRGSDHYAIYVIVEP